MTTKAFREGQITAQHGLPISLCPYRPNSKSFNEFLMGYASALREKQKYEKNPRKLSQGEAIRTYKTKQLKGFKKNPETTKEDIVLQEKRGQSWFTMATFNKIQKEFAIQLGKHLHRKYPNKAFRILG